MKQAAKGYAGAAYELLRSNDLGFCCASQDADGEA